MNLYEACKVFDLWHVVKARAQVWSISIGDHSSALHDLKDKAKSRFKELALQHHPDKGGDNNKYLEIQTAHDLIKSASVLEFVDALDLEELANTKYFAPGSTDCVNCSKWSALIGVCATGACTGYKQYTQTKKTLYTYVSGMRQQNENQAANVA